MRFYLRNIFRIQSILSILLIFMTPAFVFSEDLMPLDTLYQDMSVADGSMFLVKSTNKKNVYFWYMAGQKCKATVSGKIVSVKCPSEAFTTEPDSGDIAVKSGGVVLSTATEGTLVYDMHFATIGHVAKKEAEKHCLKFEPKVVDLKGTLQEIVFPGPPNYESVETGDTPEHSLILQLKDPICVQGDPSSDMNSETVRDIKQVQVALVTYKKSVQKMIDRNITVRGTLFSAHTGHHRTPVLIDAKDIKIAK